ncbi:MAG: DegV family protein [Lachnospirales bacterium]
MNKEKIAILIDSSTGVPKEYIEKYGIYVVPLNITIGEMTYIDGVDITSETVYKNLDKEIPKTSLPTGESISNIFDKILEEGYEKVLVITISSKLSGTGNFIKIISEDFEKLDVFVLDTKNIDLAAGMTAIAAARDVERGATWDEVKERACVNAQNTKVYFSVPSLNHLRKGGRVSHFTAIVGEGLSIKPIISCDDEGILCVKDKVRGWNKTLKKMLDIVDEYLNLFDKEDIVYNIAIAHGNVYEEATHMRSIFMKRLPEYNEVYEDILTPIMAIHGGPGVIGIGVQVLKE